MPVAVRLTEATVWAATAAVTVEKQAQAAVTAAEAQIVLMDQKKKEAQDTLQFASAACDGALAERARMRLRRHANQYFV